MQEKPAFYGAELLYRSQEAGSLQCTCFFFQVCLWRKRNCIHVFCRREALLILLLATRAAVSWVLKPLRLIQMLIYVDAFTFSHVDCWYLLMLGKFQPIHEMDQFFSLRSKSHGRIPTPWLSWLPGCIFDFPDAATFPDRLDMVRHPEVIQSIIGNYKKNEGRWVCLKIGYLHH